MRGGRRERKGRGEGDDFNDLTVKKLASHATKKE